MKLNLNQVRWGLAIAGLLAAEALLIAAAFAWVAIYSYLRTVRASHQPIYRSVPAMFAFHNPTITPWFEAINLPVKLLSCLRGAQTAQKSA